MVCYMQTMAMNFWIASGYYNRKLKYCLFFSGTTSIIGLSDVTENKLIWRQVVAELVGTFLLTSIGVASCIAITESNAPHVTSIALCFGLLVGSIVQVSISWHNYVSLFTLRASIARCFIFIFRNEHGLWHSVS